MAPSPVAATDGTSSVPWGVRVPDVVVSVRFVLLTSFMDALPAIDVDSLSGA